MPRIPLLVIMPTIMMLVGTGQAAPQAIPAKPPASNDTICLLIQSAARTNGLPSDFFARVIWQESRFDADAVGPATRSGWARPRHRAIHAGDRRGAWPTGSVRPRAGTAQGGGIPSHLRQRSAISASRPPPTMPGRTACTRGSKAMVRCRRRPAITSGRSPAIRSTTGRMLRTERAAPAIATRTARC